MDISKGFILILIIFLCLSFFSSAQEKEYYVKPKALVLEEESIEYGKKEVQEVKAQIVEGEFKNYIVEFEHTIVDSPNSIRLKENMKVFLEIRVQNNRIIGVTFIDIVRDIPLTVLFIIFIILLIAFGGMKGLRSFIALLITGLCIIYIFIPMILKGHNAIVVTIFVSAIIITTSFILISGFTGKSLSAMLGTIGGTTISGILAIVFGNLIYLNGTSDDSLLILMMEFPYDLDYRGLLYSGMTIGALGAVMDVSMTITSVIYELRKNNKNIRIKSLVFSGLAVGKDIMATTTNTLILAYAGTSLPLFLLFIISGRSFGDIINSQYIASEVIRSLCGSIGLVLTIPITSIIAAINIKIIKS